MILYEVPMNAWLTLFACFFPFSSFIRSHLFFLTFSGPCLIPSLLTYTHVSLTCHVKRRHEASCCHHTYQLLFLLPRITNANGLEIRSTGSQSFLTVANVTDDHYGNYTCVATNTLGMTNASLFLFSKYGSGEKSKWISQNVAYLQWHIRIPCR